MGRGGSSSGGGGRSGGSSSRSSSGSRGSFSSGRSRGYGGGSSSRSSSSAHRSSGSSSSGFGGPARGGMGGGPGYGPRGFGRPAGYGPMGPRRGFGGYGGYGYGGPRGGGGCGCFSGLFGIIALVVVLLIAVPSACASSLRGCSSSSQSQGSNGSGQVELNAQPIETNTKRQKLDAADCVESSAWIDDQAGWLSNQDKVINAMRSFYDQTGVQPYLVIADEINGNKDYSTDDVEDYLRDLYDELYQDDGHLILLFCEPYENEYDPYLLVGEAAQQVVDTSGENIIYEAIDYWYTDSSLDDDAYFARIFVASANKLMYGTDFTEFN